MPAIGIDTPVIYLTADVFPDHLSGKFGLKNSQVYLTKPVKKEVLLQHIAASRSQALKQTPTVTLNS